MSKTETPQQMDAATREAAAVAEQFRHHAPTTLQIDRMASIRNKALDLAMLLLATVPPGADRSAAIRKLREAVMTANAGIVLGPEEW